MICAECGGAQTTDADAGQCAHCGAVLTHVRDESQSGLTEGSTTLGAQPSDTPARSEAWIMPVGGSTEIPAPPPRARSPLVIGVLSVLGFCFFCCVAKTCVGALAGLAAMGGSVPSTPAQTHVSSDGMVRVQGAAGFFATQPSRGRATLKLERRSSGAVLTVSAFAKSMFRETTLQAYARAVAEEYSAPRGLQIESERASGVSGLPSVELVMRGALEGVRVVFELEVVETETHFVLFVVGTEESLERIDMPVLRSMVETAVIVAAVSAPDAGAP